LARAASASTFCRCLRVIRIWCALATLPLDHLFGLYQRRCTRRGFAPNPCGPLCPTKHASRGGLRYLVSEEVEPDPFVDLDDVLVGFEESEALFDESDELFESLEVASFFLEAVSVPSDDLPSSDGAPGAPFFA
jgi:hypothetical protein